MKTKFYVKGLDKAFFEICQYLRLLGRKESTLDDYRLAYSHLRDFYRIHRVCEIDPVVNELFIKTTLKLRRVGALGRNSCNNRVRLANYMNNICEGKRITSRRKTISRDRTYLPLSGKAWEPNDCNKAILKAYEDCLSTLMSALKVANRISQIKVLLGFLETNNTMRIEDVTPRLLVEFYLSAINAGFKYIPLRNCIRQFLSFAEENELVAKGLLNDVLRMKSVSNTDILPYFTAPEINAILGSIDTSTGEGKRDLALMLLEATTGIRGCDIISLRLADVDLKNKAVTFVQRKTGVRIQLPLMDVVATAIADYIANGRPRTNSTNLFVSHRFPYGEIKSLSTLFYKLLANAGIGKEKGDRKGFHAFRRTLGGMLLASGTAPELISQILGHQDRETVTRYMPYGIKALEVCVMAMPELTGALREGFSL